VLICPSGGGGQPFKADAIIAQLHLISTTRKASRFTIADLAATKTENGKSWSCGGGGRAVCPNNLTSHGWYDNDIQKE
jgi:hypothetical protein